MAVIPNIIDQHHEDSAFNWLLRDSAISAPHYALKDLAQLDDRVEANIDGLRIAGDFGWEICREAMAIGEPGEIFTAGVLAFETLIPERMNAMLDAVESDEELMRALVSALGWIDFNHIAQSARKLIGAGLPFLRYIGLAVYAVHRSDPGSVLAQLLNDADRLVRARALKAVGELGRLDLLPVVRGRLEDREEMCRFYAAWTVTRLGAPWAVATLMQLARKPGLYSRRACELAVRGMPVADAFQWVSQSARSSSMLRTAAVGFGALADPAAVFGLIDGMCIPEIARPAGEAFSMITGLDLAYENLETDAPEGFAVGPTEDPEDEDVALDPDEDLPWPDPERIARWWRENQKNYQPGRRYLCGKAISRDQCVQVLKNGFQRQRAAAAFELGLMNPGHPFFEVRAPGFVQQRRLRNA